MQLNMGLTLGDIGDDINSKLNGQIMAQKRDVPL